jgi:hypothetical protein
MAGPTEPHWGWNIIGFIIGLLSLGIPLMTTSYKIFADIIEGEEGEQQESGTSKFWRFLKDSILYGIIALALYIVFKYISLAGLPIFGMNILQHDKIDKLARDASKTDKLIAGLGGFFRMFIRIFVAVCSAWTYGMSGWLLTLPYLLPYNCYGILGLEGETYYKIIKAKLTTLTTAGGFGLTEAATWSDYIGSLWKNNMWPFGVFLMIYAICATNLSVLAPSAVPTMIFVLVCFGIGAAVSWRLKDIVDRKVDILTADTTCENIKKNTGLTSINCRVPPTTQPHSTRTNQPTNVSETGNELQPVAGGGGNKSRHKYLKKHQKQIHRKVKKITKNKKYKN